MFATLLVFNLPINRGVCTVFIQLNAAAFTIFFRDSSAAFVRGRLFKIHFIYCKYGN